jgi:hypothetical protein
MCQVIAAEDATVDKADKSPESTFGVRKWRPGRRRWGKS